MSDNNPERRKLNEAELAELKLDLQSGRVTTVYPEWFGAVLSSPTLSTEREKCHQPKRECRSHTDDT